MWRSKCPPSGGEKEDDRRDQGTNGLEKCSIVTFPSAIRPRMRIVRHRFHRAMAAISFTLSLINLQQTSNKTSESITHSKICMTLSGIDDSTAQTGKYPCVVLLFVPTVELTWPGVFHDSHERYIDDGQIKTKEVRREEVRQQIGNCHSLKAYKRDQRYIHVGNSAPIITSIDTSYDHGRKSTLVLYFSQCESINEM